MIKFCTKCKNGKNTKEFSFCSRYKDGLTFYCTKCTNSYSTAWAKRNPEKRAKAIAKSSWKNQGIIIDFNQYEQLFEHQKGLCAICGQEEAFKGKRLAVDHCHKTKKIRGLLCHRCNSRVLPVVETFPDLVEKSKEYLTRI